MGSNMSKITKIEIDGNTHKVDVDFHAIAKQECDNVVDTISNNKDVFKMVAPELFDENGDLKIPDFMKKI